MTKIAKTGLILNIKGEAPATDSEECSSIAFRTDMDGLLMKEMNDFEYQS